MPLRIGATDSLKGLENGHIREIYLLRHGQYHRQLGDEGKLTTLGRKQADLAAKRLQTVEFNRILYSSLPRAAETAERVQKLLEVKKFQKSHKIWEVLPPVNRDFSELYPKSKQDAYFRGRQKKYAEAAFEEIFSQPIRKNSRDLIVTHGNLMRYLMLRALDFDVRQWPRFDVKQCALAVFAVDVKGQIKVMSFNDYGHIPQKMQTYL